MKRILIVEDEEVAREVLVQALELLGYKTLAAENGRYAKQILKHKPVDLILTDIYMPEVDGLELLEYVRSNGYNLPVVLITGFDATEAHQALKKYDRTSLLLKPFRLTTLKSVIESALNEGESK